MREEIMVLSARISRCHEHCCRFLSAAGSLLGDSCRIIRETMLTQKAVKAAQRIALAEFKGGGPRRGKESVRFLSAITDRGFVQFDETAELLCDRIYHVEDDCGAVSRLLLSTLRDAALEAGFDAISCYCPLAPFDKLEHLFIPALRLGFMTVNDYHKPVGEPYKILRSRRFTDAEQLKKYRRRIAFNKKAAAQLLEEAARLLAEAKAQHDLLESCYRSAMDFEEVDAVCAKTLQKYREIFREYAL